MRMIAKKNDRSPGRKVFFFASFLFLLISQANGQTLATVRVYAGATVAGDRVVLADVAAIDGDRRAAERLRLIPLGYAPAIGATREIARTRIAMSISAAGFGEGEVDLLSPATISVSRASQTLARDEIERAMERAIIEPLQATGMDARFAKLDAPASIAMPTGQVDLRATAVGVTNIFAPFAASLEIRVGGVVFKRMAVNAEVEAFADVHVAAADIEVNAKIRQENLRIERRRITRPIANYSKAGDAMAGLVAVRSIKAGDELTRDAFAVGLVVRTGDSVRIVGRSGDLNITVDGIAKASGRIGDRIPVANAESKTILQAIVAGEGVVRVAF